MGAESFGFRTIWINRAGNPDEYATPAPNAVIRDLESLPALKA
jgi:2-haloacid dehalogenase